MGSKRKSGGGGQERSTVEYKEKRLKNNVAVKKSRDKSKAKAREAQMRVQHLQVQNEQLQQTVDNMTSELRYLKDLLISQAGTGNGTSEYLSPATAADLEDLLQDNAPRDLGKLTTVLNEVRRIQNLQKMGMDPGTQGQGYGSGGNYQDMQSQNQANMYQMQQSPDLNGYDLGNHFM